MTDTTDPALRSWIEVPGEHPFPIQNLPYGVFTRPDEEPPRVGVRIGDFVLDLKVLEHAGLFRQTALGEEHVFCKRALNKLMSRGRAAWSSARARISELLSRDNPTLRDDRALRERALLPLERVELRMPVEIGDYTDFYSSKQHAFNVGSMFRGPDNALLPNYTWLPVAYHGRASSVTLSGTPIRRPCGQTKADADATPRFGPSRALDFELELGFFTGPQTRLGEPIPIEHTDEHIFGLTLVNDWSARDIQKWEYVPLGPFLAKNFATSISPWVTPLEALAPFRVEPPEQQPRPLDYLSMGMLGASAPGAGWAYDIQLEVALQTPRQRDPFVLSGANFRHMYWTMNQQLAHHTSSGCNTRPGDLMASGTISGPTPDSYGSLLELAWRGERPITLPSGEQRRFLEDGDSVTLRGACVGDGYRVGLGECSGTIVPPRL